MSAVKPDCPRITSVIVLMLLFLTAPLAAQDAQFVFDPAQTRVDFTLDAFLHSVHGTFRMKRGEIHFDPATGKAGGLIVVNATSGDSGNAGRDRKMHGVVLESARYPEITFVPVRVIARMVPEGQWQYELQGIFGLHGAEHELSATGSVQVTGDRFTARTRFIVPYEKWGLKNPSTFVLRVSDKVVIDIQASGRFTPAGQ